MPTTNLGREPSSDSHAALTLTPRPVASTGPVPVERGKRPPDQVVDISNGPAQGSYITASYLRLHNVQALVTMLQRQPVSASNVRVSYLLGEVAAARPAGRQNAPIPSHTAPAVVQQKTASTIIDVSKLRSVLSWADVLSHFGPLVLPVSYGPKSLDFGNAERTFLFSDNVTRLTGTVKYHAHKDGTLAAFIEGSGFEILSVQALSGKIQVADHNGHKHIIDVESIIGNPVAVRSGQEVLITVGVMLPNSAPDGNHQATLRLVTPDGNATVPLSVQLSSSAQDLYVYPKGDRYLRIPQGDTVSVDVTIVNLGAPTQVTANLSSAPNGVSLDAFSIHVDNHESKDATLVFRADPNANWTTGDVANVDLAAFGLPQAASLAFGVDVFPPIFLWSWHSEKTKVVLDTTLTVHPNGDYEWNAHLHDTSTWYGDTYQLMVGLPYKNASGATEFHYLVADGSLGAKFSGPAVDGDVYQAGNSPVLAQNYQFAIRTGWSARLHVDGDPWDLLPYVLEAAKKYGPDVIALAGL